MFSSLETQFNGTYSDSIISEPKDFFSIFFCIFEIYIKFRKFSKKDDPPSRCISHITVSEKGDSINVCKIPLKRSLPQKSWQKVPKTVVIFTTLPLSYLCIPVNIILLEAVYVNAMQNLKTVS